MILLNTTAPPYSEGCLNTWPSPTYSTLDNFVIKNKSEEHNQNKKLISYLKSS